MIADPTDVEESLCLGKLTIVMNENKLCYIHKPGMLLYDRYKNTSKHIVLVIKVEIIYIVYCLYRWNSNLTGFISREYK